MKSEVSIIQAFSHPCRVLFGLGLSLIACSGGQKNEEGDGDGAEVDGMGGGGQPTQMSHGDGDYPSMGGDFMDSEPREDEVIGSKGRAFEPAGIQLKYTGTDDGGLKIVAYTLHQSYGPFEEPVFLIAVKNTGSDTICDVRLTPKFYSAQGTLLGEANGIGAVSSPMYFAYGEPTPCIGPGEVGMDDLDFPFEHSIDVSQVARIDYGVSGDVIPSALPVDNVIIDNLMLESVYTDAFAFTGTMRNGLSQTIESPSVDIFVVDPLGRPLASMPQIELISVPAGGNWNFQTLSYDGEIDSFVVYMKYRYPFEF